MPTPIGCYVDEVQWPNPFVASGNVVRFLVQAHVATTTSDALAQLHPVAVRAIDDADCGALNLRRLTGNGNSLQNGFLPYCRLPEVA